uniref:Putative secreted protein n=1 Tax=Ixodes ricinus TaxID=34613 RepID=A0A6B0U497_IXORI
MKHLANGNSLLVLVRTAHAEEKCSVEPHLKQMPTAWSLSPSMTGQSWTRWPGWRHLKHSFANCLRKSSSSFLRILRTASLISSPGSPFLRMAFFSM